MAKRKNKHYPEEFKQEAVALVLVPLANIGWLSLLRIKVDLVIG